MHNVTFYACDWLESVEAAAHIIARRVLVIYGSAAQRHVTMFRAIGAVIVLYYLSTLFSQSFIAADAAMSASFYALESSLEDTRVPPP